MGLVLKRRVGERVLIGDDVVVEVTGCSPGRVVLHIEAPAEVEVRRAGPDLLAALEDSLKPGASS